MISDVLSAVNPMQTDSLHLNSMFENPLPSDEDLYLICTLARHLGGVTPLLTPDLPLKDNEVICGSNT